MDKKLKILIVEDEFTSRILLEEMLNSYGDCHTTSNSSEAMALLIESLTGDSPKYDLVCLDIAMPQMDGLELLKVLRNTEKSMNVGYINATKVMMVTGFDDVENIYKATIEGKCHSYITKPVSRERLRSELATLQLIV